MWKVQNDSTRSMLQRALPKANKACEKCLPSSALLDFANPKAPLSESRIFSCIWVMRARMTSSAGPVNSAQYSRGSGIVIVRNREALESVSLCTRFSGFSTISSSSFNRLSWKLVGMFFGIVPIFVAKDFQDFARRRFLAQICANSCAHAHFGAYLRDEALSNRILGYEHWNSWNYPKEHAYQFSA